MRNAASAGLVAAAVVLCATGAWWLLREPDPANLGGGFGRGDAPAAVEGSDPAGYDGRPVARTPFHDESVDAAAEGEAAAASRATATLSAVTGRVTDERGSPLAGAAVEIYETVAVNSYEDFDMVEFARRMLEPAPAAAAAVSGPDGAFAFAGIRPGAWFVVAAMDGRRTAMSRTLSVVKDAAAPHAVLELGRAERQAGRVIDGGGAPLTAAKVSWTEQRGGLDAVALRREKSVDAEGRFELSDLADGPYVIFVRAPGFPLKMKQMSGTPEKKLEIVLQRPATLRGRVVNDADGTPLADVALTTIDLRNSDGCIAQTKSKADGSFEIEHAPTGVGLALIASKSGFVAKAPESEDGDPELRGFGQGVIPLAELRSGQIVETTVRMSGGGTVAGTVVDADTGAGLPGVAVRLRSSEAFSISGPRRERAITDEAGKFSIAPVAAGTFRVVADREGFFPEAPPPVDEDPGESSVEDFGPADQHEAPPAGGRLDGIVVKLRRGARIEGLVVDDSGLPVKKASVHWRPANPVDSDPYSAAPPGRSGVTDSEGKISFEGVPPGEFYLYAAHPDHPAGGAIKITVAPMVKTPDFRIALSKGGTVEGKVVYPDGSPGVGVTLMFIASEKTSRPPQNPFDAVELKATADASGRFTFRHLPFGKGRIGVHWSSTKLWNPNQGEEREEDGETEREWIVYQTVAQDTEIEVASTPAAPMTIRLLLPLEISGIVVDEDGKPVGGATIMAEAVGADDDYEADPFTQRWSGTQSGADGRFVLKGLSPNSYKLTAYHHPEEVANDGGEDETPPPPPGTPETPPQDPATPGTEGEAPPVKAGSPGGPAQSRSGQLEGVEAGGRGVKIVIAP